MSENITLTSEKPLLKAVKRLQDTIQKGVSSIADNLGVPDELMNAVLSYLDEDQPDLRGWREVISLFLAERIFLERLQKQNLLPGIPAEMLAMRIGSAINIEYVWNKIA